MHRINAHHNTLKPWLLLSRSFDLLGCTLALFLLIYPGFFSETPGIYTQVSSQHDIRKNSKPAHLNTKKISWVHQLVFFTAYQPHFSVGPNEFDICKGHLWRHGWVINTVTQNSFFRSHRKKQLEKTLTQKPGYILSSLTSVFSPRLLSGFSESGQFCSSPSPREQERRIVIVFRIS